MTTCRGTSIILQEFIEDTEMDDVNVESPEGLGTLVQADDEDELVVAAPKRSRIALLERVLHELTNRNDVKEMIKNLEKSHEFELVTSS